MRIVWNNQAKNDLRSIKSYYQDAGTPTERFEQTINGIITAVDCLEHSPQAGRVVPEIGDPDFREILWKNWRIIYLLPTSSKVPIEILNVIHGARQFGGL
jgi:plasmid stabilization system protein ParE